MANKARQRTLTWKEWALIAFVALCGALALLTMAIGLRESRRARLVEQAYSVSILASPTPLPSATPTPHPLATPTPTLADWEIQE